MTARRPRPAKRSLAATRSPAWRFALAVAAWALPVALVWFLFAPYYNLYLASAGERLVRLTEGPAVTRLPLARGQDVLVTRSDTRAGGRLPYSVHLADIHFPVVLLVAMFLAVADLPWHRKLANLGYALLIAVAFHLVDLFFWVKFVYATQLGEWSLRHYGALARNFWGLGKHVLDLPVKLALPLLLWCWFYLGRLLGRPDAADG